MNLDARKLTGPDKQIAAGQQQQGPRKSVFARAVPIVAPPLITGFLLGFGIMYFSPSKHKSESQPAAPQPTKSIHPDCDPEHAPPESGQYYFDERGRVHEGYRIVDGHGRVIRFCPPTWGR
ncbi:MAG: hypothetical protein AB1657_05945 [Candidatus Micrarchaeota archaeon]